MSRLGKSCGMGRVRANNVVSRIMGALVAARAAGAALAGAVAFALSSLVVEAWGQALPPCAATGTNQTCTNSIAMTGSAVGILDLATLTVTNTSTGAISGTLLGINTSAVNVTNAGTITGSSRAIVASTTVSLVDNTGTIEATSAGGAAIQGITVNVTANAGTIRASGNDGSAISGTTVNVTGNTGRIEATNIAIQTPGTATVNNLSGGVITGGRFGIFGDPGATLNVTNAAGATISGGLNGIDGVGTVRTAGTITSGSGRSVSFQGSTGTTNTLILQTGSVLNGVAGGNIDPTNNLILQGSGSANNVFLNFDNLDVQAGDHRCDHDQQRHARSRWRARQPGHRECRRHAGGSRDRHRQCF